MHCGLQVLLLLPLWWDERFEILQSGMQPTDPAWVLVCCCGHGCWQCPEHLALLTQAVHPAVQCRAASWSRSHP